jgi:hypothetical protein
VSVAAMDEAVSMKKGSTKLTFCLGKVKSTSLVILARMIPFFDSQRDALSRLLLRLVIGHTSTKIVIINAANTKAEIATV